MDHLNLILFSYLNGPATPGFLELGVARLAAEWLIWLVAIGLALGYLRSGRAGRVAIIRTGMAAVVALAVNFTIAALWYHPRPFELGVGHQLLPHAAETSFPSDHATVLFAVTFGLMAFGARRIWWSLALCSALAVAWARVWLGVHWPLDMVGSAGVAAVAIVVLRGIARYPVMAKFDQVILGLTDAVLAFLRVPPNLVPRLADGTHPMAEQAVGQESGD
ncbi:undecaprenyl-diphosphatase [Pseudophaeobacter sp. 1A09344]|uniref:undecaprenyl-diphosphatase n=1 Tax=Pseudophaeobacter sp. 1A09344 TaxID=3098144 RepID=UPI0034D57C6D